jgi:hypothetical protein
VHRIVVARCTMEIMSHEFKVPYTSRVGMYAKYLAG